VTVISLAIFLGLGKEPQPIITISFDDGYESTYNKALPILERYDLPATVFVITDNVEKEGYMKLEQLMVLQEQAGKLARVLHLTCTYQAFMRLIFTQSYTYPNGLWKNGVFRLTALQWLTRGHPAGG